MNTIQMSLVALLSVVVLTLSMRLVADQTSNSDTMSTNSQLQTPAAAVSESPQSGLPLKSGIVEASQRKSPVEEESGASATGGNSGGDGIAALDDMEPDTDGDTQDKEKVWTDIADAITSLNDMVGDEMFRDLKRTSATAMEVRVDLDYWQRVRYETRVDLKNDISNIWHLYVRQYNQDNESAVFFIDDRSGKTIDIFTQRRREEQ